MMQSLLKESLTMEEIKFVGKDGKIETMKDLDEAIKVSKKKKKKKDVNNRDKSNPN